MKKCLLLCLLIAVVQLHGGPAVSKAVRAGYERRGYVIAAAFGAAAMQLWQQKTEKTPENKRSKHTRAFAIGGAEDLLQQVVPQELTPILSDPLADTTLTQHILAGLCSSLSPQPLAEEEMRSMQLSALAARLEELLIDEFGQLGSSLRKRDATLEALMEAINTIRLDPGMTSDPGIQQMLSNLGERLHRIDAEQGEEAGSSSSSQRSVNSLIGDLRFALAIKRQ